MQKSIESSYKAIFENQESDRILEDKNEEEERLRKEKFETDPQNIVPPEILNNIGVLRMELAAQQKL